MQDQINQLAEVFSDKIREVLTPEELEAVNAENATNNGEFCATQSYIDANAYMIEAYEQVTGSELELDLNDEKTLTVLNAAWKLASDAKFNYKS